jgi:hypothetical protein
MSTRKRKQDDGFDDPLAVRGDTTQLLPRDIEEEEEEFQALPSDESEEEEE